ncbi:hypothetical protein ACGFIU_02285 [Rhodococcus oryzae]|uniref:hypothetical protein n=1 Tax=Rhodococcus oryzae TaxID=2571143 RepID=UPI00371528FC
MSNTPPHDMLDVQADQVHRVIGDQLAGFWTVDGDTAAELTPEQRGYTPPGIRREAYSWGGLARTTPGGTAPLGQAVLAVVIRAAWCLVLPYGLTNLAYWSRNLCTTPAQVRRTATLVRLFGLGLTLLFVSTVVTVSSDLIALQYLEHESGNLPSQFQALANLPPQRRLAVSLLVPAAALAVLWFVSARSRTRYDVDSAHQTAESADATPVLRRHGFWNNRGHATETAVIHVAAGVAGTVAMSALFAPPRDVRFGWVFSAIAIVAVLAMVAGAVRLVLTSERGVDVPVSRAEEGVPAVTWVVVAVSAAAFVAQSVLLAFGPHDADTPGGDAPRLDGLIAVPAVLVLLLLALALAGLSIRRMSPWWTVALATALGMAAVAYLCGQRGPSVVVGAAVFLVLLALALPGSEFQAWSGRAVGVFMLLALGGAMLLSNLVVVGVGNWLNGSGGAAELVSDELAGRQTEIRIPPIFGWFGVGLVAAAAVLVVVVVVAGCCAVRWAAFFRTRSAGATPSPATATADAIALVDPDTVPAERLANAAHRAEPAIGVLAALALLALLPCVILPLRPWQPDEEPPPLHVLTTWGALLAAALAAALAGALALRPRSGRPLGIVWDLLGVVPRAAHPFGPPSYSERAVPELVARCDAWLRADDGNRVVLSAHSMGSVLAVAAVLDPRSLALVERGALLTYGSQLRAYFGRIFPELFGPDAIANAPASGARPLAPDEFLGDDAGPAPQPRAQTLAGLLRGTPGRPRWINLWRETDHLGFPAYSRLPNRVDVRADEVDRSGYLPTVAGHSGYVRTPQYRDALAELRRFIEA